MSGRLDFSPAAREEILRIFDGCCFNCYSQTDRVMECAHIFSASEGNIVRSNKFIRPDFVSSSLNGVLACPTCHRLYDSYHYNIDAPVMLNKALDARARKAVFGRFNSGQPVFAVWFYLNCAYYVIPLLERLSELRDIIIKDRYDALDMCDELASAEMYISELIRALHSGLFYTSQYIRCENSREVVSLNNKIMYLYKVFQFIINTKSRDNAVLNGNYQLIESNINEVNFYLSACVYPLAAYFSLIDSFLRNIDGGNVFALRTIDSANPLARLGNVCIDLGYFSQYGCNSDDILLPLLPGAMNNQCRF